MNALFVVNPLTLKDHFQRTSNVTQIDFHAKVVAKFLHPSYLFIIIKEYIWDRKTLAKNVRNSLKAGNLF